MKKLQPAPIGIDLGSYKSKIAVAKRGGVQIITNQANFRQTPCVVGFGNAQRNIGQAGFNKMKSNFKDTIVAPQRFIGLTPQYPHIRYQTKYCPAKTDNSSGKIQFQVNYQGQKESLVAEQALAAYFNKLKFIIQHNELQSKQAVIAIPGYLTQTQRKGILTAAKIAELHVTRLINQSTAISLDYGIFRKSDLDPKVPRNVLFLDFGQTQFGAFTSSFLKDQMTALTQHYQRNLGCRDLDSAVLQRYRQIFQKTSGGCDIMQNRKAIVKLMENIQRQRKILSSNVDFQMNIECLMQDNDLRYTMTRDQFNQVCKDVFTRLQQTLVKVREQIKAKGIQLHSVQLIGGGTRIPQFLRTVRQTFGVQPSRTLNSSQSVARGAALMAAIKSPLFRVAQYTLNERAPYGVKFSWNFVQGNNLLGTNSQAYPQKQKKMIFQAGAKVPSSKTIKFARKQAIQVLIQYDPPVPGFNKNIAYYVTKAQNPKQQTFGVTFKIKFTQDGLVTFSDCTFLQQWTQQIKIPKKPSTTTTPPPATQTPTEQGAQKPAEVPPAPPAQQFQIKKVKKQKCCQVKYESNTFQFYTEKEVHDYFTIQSTMVNQDRIILQTYQKKNQLQSLAYNWRQKLSSTHKDYTKSQKIPQLISYMQSVSQWLYGQGQDSNRGTYASKIDELNSKVNDIQKRYQTYQALKNQFIIFANVLKQNSDQLQCQDPKYAHITVQQRQVIQNQIQAHYQWATQVDSKHSNHPKYENALISINDIQKKYNQISEKVRKLLNKPVPKPATPTPAPKEQTKMDQQKPAQKSNTQQPKMDVQ